MQPREVRFVASFPLNANGKVDRKALLGDLAAGSLADDAGLGTGCPDADHLDGGLAGRHVGVAQAVAQGGDAGGLVVDFKGQPRRDLVARAAVDVDDAIA